jgi:hypothetical protein
MSDHPAELPNAVVTGYAAGVSRATGTDGEEHPIVILSLEFQVSAGHTAVQNFIMHSLDSQSLRSILKNPPRITPTTDQEVPQ